MIAADFRRRNLVRCFARSLLVVAVATASAASFAQDGYLRGPDGTVVGVAGGVVNGPVGSQSAAGIPKGPISITLERKSLQTLWDGTHITRATHEVFVRDSKGRTRTETDFGPVPGTEVQNHSVTVSDPIAELSYVWQEGLPNARKVYTVRQTHAIRGVLGPQAGANPLMRTLPDTSNSGQGRSATGSLGSSIGSAETPVSIVPPPPPPPQPPSAGNLGVSQAAGVRPEVTRDPLGQRIVGGLTCMAQRTTTVFPVDYFGNDRPITVMVESCMSQEAGRVIQETREDPRTGVQTITLLSASVTEPEASLFLPPADYTELKLPAPRQP
jgi:hypothetical protein